MTGAATIFALSSGRPPAAVAVVRISGPAAHDAARRLAGDLPETRRAALRTLTDPRDGAVIDEALLLRFDGPASATGEDVAEFHCHGGRAVVDALLAALGAIDGLRPAEPGEFTRRAFANGRIDLTEAEGLADLLEAETESQRRAALVLAGGGLRREVEQWRRRLVELSARAEAAIDYVGDEAETAIDEDQLRDEARELADELGDWLERPRAEILHDGVRVVVAGPPNVGKSSLVNVIAGSDRAIVTSVPGTTRDAIEVPLAIEGLPFVLVDTAGLRDSDDPVERIGIARATGELERADILLWLGEPGDAPDHRQLLPLHSRCDLAGREAAPEGSIAVSAVTGEGVGGLIVELATRARTLVVGDSQLALNRRQATLIEAAARAISQASPDLVTLAENLRHARLSFDRISGLAGVEEVLDALFGRFCLGK